jgi:hypothetical protein
MGHVRLGRLPRTIRWRRVVNLLNSAPHDAPAVGRATLAAADSRLSELSRDPSLVHCYWVLTRIASASRAPDFALALKGLGIDLPTAPSALGFIAGVNDQVRGVLVRLPESGPFGDVASLALRRALSETVGTEGRTLFGSSFDDAHRAFAAHATPDRFGDIAQRFFGDVLARTLRFYVDKELAYAVGAGHAMQGGADAEAFSQALDTYARESARIMRDFAADWYSKRNWESGGAISREEASGFVAVAVRKLRRELAQAPA